jgi:NAD(P)H-hydrate repair Nnr-like enzyme with NAD(P)H-hydrate epimerase domain
MDSLQLMYFYGRAVAQAVSRWLPAAAARVLVRAAFVVCGGQSGTGAGFLLVLRFPLPIIPPTFPSS